MLMSSGIDPYTINTLQDVIAAPTPILVYRNGAICSTTFVFCTPYSAYKTQRLLSYYP